MAVVVVVQAGERGGEPRALFRGDGRAGSYRRKISTINSSVF